MPESKNSSELRKLPGYKRRATETRRGASKRTRPDTMSAAPVIPAPSDVPVPGLSMSHDDTFYSIESDTSVSGVPAPSQYSSYNCDISPVPIMHCSGCKLHFK